MRRATTKRDRETGTPSTPDANEQHGGRCQNGHDFNASNRTHQTPASFPQPGPRVGHWSSPHPPLPVSQPVHHTADACSPPKRTISTCCGTNCPSCSTLMPRPIASHSHDVHTPAPMAGTDRDRGPSSAGPLPLTPPPAQPPGREGVPRQPTPQRQAPPTSVTVGTAGMTVQRRVGGTRWGWERAGVLATADCAVAHATAAAPRAQCRSGDDAGAATGGRGGGRRVVAAHAAGRPPRRTHRPGGGTRLPPGRACRIASRRQRLSGCGFTVHARRLPQQAHDKGGRRC